MLHKHEKAETHFGTIAALPLASPHNADAKLETTTTMPIITRRRAKRPTTQSRHTGALRVSPYVENFVDGAGPRLGIMSGREIGAQWRHSDSFRRRRLEVYQLNPYKIPSRWPECPDARHRKKTLLAEYDAKIDLAREGHDLDAKRRILALLGELDSAGHTLTGRMVYAQDILTRQLTTPSLGDRSLGETTSSCTRNHRPLGR